MKLLLFILLSFLICWSHCKIEIEEVDEFDEFEELPRTDTETKFKEDLSPVADKAEVEVTVEVCPIAIFLFFFICMYYFFYRMMTNLNILMMKKNLKGLTLKDYMLMIKIPKLLLHLFQSPFILSGLVT